MANRDERFIITQLNDAPMSFAYECDGVTVLVGQAGSVFASYRDGDSMKYLDFYDEKIVHAFVSMVKAAIVSGMIDQTLGDPKEVIDARIRQLKKDDRRPFSEGLWRKSDA